MEETRMDRLEPTRRESDFLGEVQVPAHAFWGVHTYRALQNFPISGHPIGRWMF